MGMPSKKLIKFFEALTEDEKKDFLVQALEEQNTKILQLLINLGVDINQTVDDKGNSLLHLAIGKNYVKVIDTLLACKEIDITVANKADYTPLGIAAWNGHTEIVEKFLQDDKYKKDVSKLGSTLSEAVENGKTDVVRVLLQHIDREGLDFDLSKGKSVYTFLDCAVQKGFTDIASLLEEHGARRNLVNTTQQPEEHPNYPNISRHYTKQIVVRYGSNFEDGRVTGLLEKKWRTSHLANTFHVISGKDFHAGDYKKKITFNENEFIQIYIIAHGDAGSHYLSVRTGEMKGRISYDTLAENLVGLIGQQKAVINLLACNAGKGSKVSADVDGASFAAKLHAALSSKMKIQGRTDIPDVIARTTVVLAPPNIPIVPELLAGVLGEHHPKTTEAWNTTSIVPQSRHQQPGSKVVYSHDEEGNQVKYDAYSYKWKDKIIKQINLLIEVTALESDKKSLFEMNKKFISMRPKDIFADISLELGNVQSPLHGFSKPSSSSRRRLFFPERNKMESLMIEGRKFFESPHTIHDPVKTGRKKDLI